MKTEIISNGSKWYGQEPDSIEKLLEVLKKAKLEDRFFGSTYYGHSTGWIPKGTTVTMCPISKKGGKWFFFGNFEEISHVFNIETTDPKVAKRLIQAIVNNSGWKEYINLNLPKNRVCRN